MLTYESSLIRRRESRDELCICGDCGGLPTMGRSRNEDGVSDNRTFGDCDRSPLVEDGPGAGLGDGADATGISPREDSTLDSIWETDGEREPAVSPIEPRSVIGARTVLDTFGEDVLWARADISEEGAASKSRGGKRIELFVMASVSDRRGGCC